MIDTLEQFTVRRATVALTVVLLGTGVCGTGAQAYTYTEGFASGAQGWAVGNYDGPPLDLGDTEEVRASGGVGDSAYLWGNRTNLAPMFEPVDGVAAQNALGDLEAIYGRGIAFSYYGRIFPSEGGGPGGDRAVGHAFYGAASGWWNLSVADHAPMLSDWARVEFAIDTDWTDEEARANGWERLTGSASWTQVLHDVSVVEFLCGWKPSPQGVSDRYVAGIDEVRIRAVPLPGPLTLFASSLGGLAAFRRRRRAGA
jgi:hypothetical protein